VVKQPHVCIIVQNLPLPGDRRVWLECNALRDAGYTVSAITPKAPGDAAYELREGIHLYKYDAPPQTRSMASFAYEFAYCLEETARLLRRVKREVGHIDVLQACNPPDTFWSLAKFLKRGGTKFVFDQHDLCPELFRSRFEKPNKALLKALLWLEKQTYATADHVIVTNESYRDVAYARGNRTPANTTVVRTGPDSTRLTRGEADLSLRDGRPYLAVYVGVMGPQDGVDVVLRAAHHLRYTRGRHDITFAVLGRGDCYDELCALRKELKLEEFVSMPGRVSDEELFGYLSSSDVGLSPDPPNPLNDVSTMNKTMEYMAFELPVIAFDLKETRVSAHGACAYVETPTPEAYGDGLVELLADPERRAAMGAEGRRRVLTDLDWRHQRPGYLAAYDLLTGTTRQPAVEDSSALPAVP
jgi:glycosyltransferase involved in cell wall biosynthesis